MKPPVSNLSKSPVVRAATSERPRGRQEALIALSLFAFLIYLYLLFLSGVSHNPDEWFYLRGAEDVIQGNLANVSSHGWLFALLLTPFYLLSMALPRVGMIQVTALLNIMLTALTASVLFLCLSELHYSRKSRLFTALAFAMATIAWPHSHYLLREPVTALMLLVSLWGAIRFWRKPRLGAFIAFVLAFALVLLTKSVAIVLLPFFSLLLIIPMLRRWIAIDPKSGVAAHPRLADLVQHGRVWWISAEQRGLRGWLIPALVVVGLLLFISFAAWRIPLPKDFVPTYQEYLREQGVNLPNTLALWISPGWGILIYSPVLWICVIGLIPFARCYPAITFATVGGSIAFTMAASPHPFWWGNWAFGPRQMVLLLPLLCLPMPAGLGWLKSKLGHWGSAIAAGLFAVGVAFQLVGLLAPLGDYVRQIYFPAGVTGPDVAWNLRLWPIAGLVRFVRPAMLDLAWIASRDTGRVMLKWPVALALLGLAITSGAWLLYLVRQPARRRPVLPWVISLLLALLWLPLAVRSVQSAYMDPRFQPELGFLAAADAVRQEARPGDLLVTDLWTERLTGPAEAMLNYCQGHCPPRLDLIRETLVDREENWQSERLADLAGYNRAWLVLDRVAEGDLNSIIEQWLNQVGYLERCDWTGPQVRLCRYSLAAGDILKAAPVQAAFSDSIQLDRAEVRLAGQQPGQQTAMPGDTVQVTLEWQALAAPTGNFVVSLQLLEPDGTLVASADRTPGNGFQPTGAWLAGEQVIDRFALSLPANAAPGAYHLMVVLYDPATGQRLPVQNDGAEVSDHLLLLKLSVEH